MRWTKSTLLNLFEVILRIFIQLQNSNLNKRIVFMRPDFSNIKDIPLITLGVLFRHNLDTEFPLWIILIIYRLKEILNSIVSVFTLQLISFFSTKILDSLHRLKMPLDPEALSFGIDPSISMRPISIHVSVTIWGSSIRE
jgi:hypothetical protein